MRRAWISSRSATYPSIYYQDQSRARAGGIALHTAPPRLINYEFQPGARMFGDRWAYLRPGSCNMKLNLFLGLLVAISSTEAKDQIPLAKPLNAPPNVVFI